MADEEKRYSRQLIGKVVVTKSGKKFGEVSNISFDTRSGELMNLVLRNPTSYIGNMELEQDKKGNWIIPFNSVIAVGDFIVVSEEDIL